MKNCLAVFVCFSAVLSACKQTAKKMVEEGPATITVGTIITDSVAPPVLTPITAANAPKAIPAPKPKVVPLKYPFGIGKPSIVNFSVADGLPQNVTLSMAKDKQGNIWIGGLGFVSKYDGSRFTNYSMKNGMGNSADGTSSLVVDSRNTIWVGKYDGLYRFDGQAFNSTPLSSYDKNLNIRKIGVDKKGAIWVGTANGLFRIMGDSMTHFGENEGLTRGAFIGSMLIDRSDSILVNVREVIYRLEGKLFVPYSKIPIIAGKNQAALCKDSHDNLWVSRRNPSGDYRILIRYHGNDSMLYSAKEGFDVRSSITGMIEDKNGMIWIATEENGVIQFDGNRFINYTTSDGLPADKITSLLEDDYGNIWLSTSEGISRLSYQYMNQLEKVAIGGSYRDYFARGPDRTMWVYDGNANSLIEYRKEEALVYDLSAFNKRPTTLKIFVDQTGQVWLCNWNFKSIIRFDKNIFYVYGPEQGVTLNLFSTISEDEQGNLWFSGWDGVMKFNGKSMLHYGEPQGFPARANAFFPANNGTYWIAGDSSLSKFDGKQVNRYDSKDGYFGDFVWNITEDPYGNIWLASDQGAIRFNGKQFTGYGHVEGLNSSMSAITVDTARRLVWFNSKTGLAAVSFDEINSSNPVVQQYDERNGFDVIPAHISNEKAFIDSLGIWGNGYTGVYRFDYDKVRQFEKPLLQIRNIRVDNQEVVWSKFIRGKRKPKDSLTILNESVLKFGKPLDNKQQQEQQDEFGKLRFDSLQKGNLIPANLTLPYKNNSISFEFAVVSASFGKYTQYRYKLEGYQDNWSPFSSKDDAFFGNIREGKYIFRLQAISTGGAETELSYHFRVLAPWWRTWWAYTLFAIVFVSGVFLFIRRRTRALQKEKIVLEEKVTTRTAELKESLENLRATQSQLIQSEKMASLGELTAGIAHEIQNPLNFVNNFSEVNTELIDELEQEAEKGNLDDVKAIAKDIKENEQKINHHGKKADAIVKGMLQHSRSSNGVKEPADINALCDEYLRLAYHGLRAKDNTFNATLKTDFDETIEAVNIVPQDIGRVILNLINNAFYAAPLPPKGGFSDPDYKHNPTVWLNTKKVGDKILIRVRDNGPGIPQNILDKIFQPFFTTKPTGEGTGLGLSLSYDIVKAHGGEIRVETNENEGLPAGAQAEAGTIFTISLPIS